MSLVKTLFVGAAAVFTALSGQVVTAETKPLQRRPVDVSAQMYGHLAMTALREAGTIDPKLAVLKNKLRCGEITIKQFRAVFTLWQNNLAPNSIFRHLTAENAIANAIGPSALAQDNHPCTPSPKLRK